MTIGEINMFYERADVLEARGDVGPCAGCAKTFEVGEQFSMYMLKHMNPEYTRPAGILLCKQCTYTVIASPKPNI
jgi:hypothetical protein